MKKMKTEKVNSEVEDGAQLQKKQLKKGKMKMEDYEEEGGDGDERKEKKDEDEKELQKKKIKQKTKDENEKEDEEEGGDKDVDDEGKEDGDEAEMHKDRAGNESTKNKDDGKGEFDEEKEDEHEDEDKAELQEKKGDEKEEDEDEAEVQKKNEAKQKRKTKDDGKDEEDEERKLIHDFDQAARKAPLIQIELLSSILATNSSVHYLQIHGLNGLTDPHSFKRHIPVVAYGDIAPHIQRIADGDASPILCAHPITAMLLSSGTSAGKPKMIPATQESRRITTQRFLISNAYLNRAIPTVDRKSKTLSFIYAGKLSTTRGGVRAGSPSTLHLRGGNLSTTLLQWTSPLAVVLGSDVRQSMYCHLLCGLAQATEVSTISSFFAYGITEALRMLESSWEELCADIREGSLSDRVSEDALRSAVLEFLRPNAELANRIHAECAQKSWWGIIRRLWPSAKYVHSIMTGAMQPYLPYLRHYAGNLPLVNGDYGSAECTVGINLHPNCPPEDVTFTLVPFAAYFEFLPLKRKSEDLEVDEFSELCNQPVDITGVQIGEEYELIVTTLSGLYRYRLGDIVKVTGFYHAAPQFAYVCRRSVLLSINTDKTDERELYLVVEKAAQLLKGTGIELADFTSCVDHSSRPGCYVIFWELRGSKLVEDAILESCCALLDVSFNDPYKRGRSAGTIGPLRLCIVREGTFFKILQHAIEIGASPTQYKTPRCITSPSFLSIMYKSVIHACYSLSPHHNAEV